MVAFGRYFMFIISVTTTIVCANNFSEEDKTQFLNKIFKLHNDYRTIHGVQELQLIEDLSKKAYFIIKEITYTDLEEIPRGHGMNFDWRFINDNTKLDDEEAEKFFAMWYKPGKTYDYNAEPSNKNKNSFTQIVWEKTEQLGLAMILNDEQNAYAVLAIYLPSGNVIGEYRNNVKEPPKKRRI